MHKLLALLATLLLAACATQPPPSLVTVPLGTTAQATALFSYPNCLNQCPTPAPTLEDTIKHWLTLSMLRDGYGKGTLGVVTKDGQVYAQLTGVPADYGNVITGLLQSGAVGYTDAQGIVNAGKWQSDWHFFLPLGFAMQHNPTVQLLHFPPDTVMTQTQDYLQAATTKRWASLLVTNGVPQGSTDPYQTIVDIAPIAAPASAGASLEGVYDDFSNYTVSLLAQWTAGPAGSAKPTVAFGAPARAWLAEYFKLSPINVLTVSSFQPVAGRTVPVIGANHPSYIWYASDPKQYGGNQQKADAAGIVVMGQDLTASCWQVTMAATPSGDPNGALASCQGKWPANSAPVCEQFYETIRNLSPADAKAKCVPSQG
ncbi:hypothetical protein [Chitinolyticbacter meiyuanensis]|uniref:hypothetical protein n=1 Tax=Chitinolyticbacter meiyuanensis TaxID=682798 RepID=UPI0011E5CC4B|nr:hypothetical protein [Chitinolyticbacter meiyuanensis]